MAVATYSTDLIIYNDCTSVTGFAEVNGMTDTNGDGEVDTDLAIYGGECISEAQRKSGLGSISYTGTAPTWTSGWCYFIWNKFFAPNSMDTKTNGGLRVLIGQNTANYRGWYVDGSDTYPYGGWINYAVDPEQTSLATQTQGSPNTTYALLGMGYNLLNAISKGNSATVDVFRYGRGEVIITDGEAGAYGNFATLSAINDNPDNGRWGLFQDVGGSYLWKGLMSFGTPSTSVDFRDSNVVINIEDTEMTYNDFNRIEINNSSSRVDWNTVLITALGTRSPGNFEVVDDADVNFDNCFFTSMGTFQFLTNSTINTSSFRLCDQVTQGTASFDSCTFENSGTTSAALLANDLENITNCEFIGNGDGHGIEITTAGTYSFAGNQFSNFGASGSATASIFNNSGGHVTINITSGGDTPTYRNGTGATTTVNNNTLVTLTGLIIDTEVRVYDTGTISERAGIEDSTATFSFSLPAATVVDIVIHHIDYEYQRIDGYIIPNLDATLPIQQRFDRNYDNP